MQCSIDGLGTLTTEHPAASVRRPVVVDADAVYRPSDMVVLHGTQFPAWILVDLWRRWSRAETGYSERVIEAVEDFVDLGRAV